MGFDSSAEESEFLGVRGVGSRFRVSVWAPASTDFLKLSINNNTYLAPPRQPPPSPDPHDSRHHSRLIEPSTLCYALCSALAHPGSRHNNGARPDQRGEGQRARDAHRRALAHQGPRPAHRRHRRQDEWWVHRPECRARGMMLFGKAAAAAAAHARLGNKKQFADGNVSRHVVLWST